MQDKARPEAINQAERELDETEGLVKQQYQIVKRLKRLGADAKDAICLLIDLLELQQSRERRLSYLRMRGNHRQTEPNESGGGEIAKSR